MTKDRPRNRPGDRGGHGGKPRDFRNKGPRGDAPGGKPHGAKEHGGGWKKPRPERAADGPRPAFSRDAKRGDSGNDRGGGWKKPRPERAADGPRSSFSRDTKRGDDRGGDRKPFKPRYDKAADGQHRKPWPKRPPRDEFVAYEGPERPEGGEANPWGGKPRAEAERHAPQTQRSERYHPKPRQKPHEKKASFEEDGQVWIWGIHAAAAALNNPMRKITRALATRNAAQRAGLNPDALPAFVHLTDPADIDRALPADAVHQGLAVKAWPLPAPETDDFVIRPEKPLALLDQVTDPQNVGAVFRSAAAFGFAGVVLQTRNAPALGGALAKAAAGAVETVDEIRAVNISRAIDALTSAGWNVVGLDGSAEQTLEEAFAGPQPLAIVLGAEGAGLRPGVAASCSRLARIPIGAEMESLNVSNAAAIAFYEAARRNAIKPSPKQAATPAPDADAEGEEND